MWARLREWSVGFEHRPVAFRGMVVFGWIAVVSWLLAAVVGIGILITGHEPARPVLMMLLALASLQTLLALASTVLVVRSRRRTQDPSRTAGPQPR